MSGFRAPLLAGPVPDRSAARVLSRQFHGVRHRRSRLRCTQSGLGRPTGTRLRPPRRTRGRVRRIHRGDVRPGPEPRLPRGGRLHQPDAPQEAPGRGRRARPDLVRAVSEWPPSGRTRIGQRPLRHGSTPGRLGRLPDRPPPRSTALVGLPEGIHRRRRSRPMGAQHAGPGDGRRVDQGRLAQGLEAGLVAAARRPEDRRPDVGEQPGQPPDVLRGQRAADASQHAAVVPATLHRELPARGDGSDHGVPHRRRIRRVRVDGRRLSTAASRG